MLRTERTVRDFLEEFLPPKELEEVEISNGGKHLHFRLKSLGIHLTIPNTPGDRRWFLNWRGDFRRRYRQMKEEQCLVPA